MNLTQLRIGQRLALGFGGVLLLVALLTGLTLKGLGGAGQDTDRLLEMDRRVGLADEWVASTRLNVNRVMAVAKSGNNPAVDEYFKPLMAQTTERINVLQKELEASIESERGRAFLAEIAQRRQDYIGVRKTYFDTLATGDPSRADTLLMTGLLPAAERYLATMEQFREFQNGLVEAARGDVHAGIREQMVTDSLVALVAILLGLVLAWRITRSITAPLHEAVDAAHAVASGDLTRDVSSTRKDELGDLLNALGKMKASLVSTVSQVRSATDSINTASMEIASG
ncbi:MAG TPA: HAMP domain-containing protein, partial [Hydrogenophaga sp.]|uniref:HAMP domain-containing protein n=1 Tax=Hydrogenophaga sp. TaxID=1904254 RepID=UPI002CDB9A6C